MPKRASLVVQGPMQGTRVRSLTQKTQHAAEQLSPCAVTPEPALRAREPRPGLHKRRSHRNKKPRHHWQAAPICCNYRKSVNSDEDQHSQKQTDK